MIENFSVTNFKCYEDENFFELGDLNIISGTNNSGKSSLLQAIYLLSQNKTIPSKRYTFLDTYTDLDLGTVKDILNKIVNFGICQ